MTVNGVGRYQWLSTTKSELTDEIFIALRCQNAFARGAIKIRDIMIIEYQDGMENWDIPYFEGMQSVKMPVLTTTGNNLFDGEIETGSIDGIGRLVNSNIRIRSVNYTKVAPLTKYYFKCSNVDYVLKAYYAYDEDKDFIEQIITSNNYFTTKEELSIY